MDEPDVHIPTDRVRAGATPHVTRYILPLSLGMIVLLFAALLLLWR